MEFIGLFFSTVALRPYVFVFLAVYLVGCTLHLGLRRALVFMVVGYFIAWGAEYSSIHNGLPFGHYFYIESTKGQEMWFRGVPFMDSLSFTFLAWCSYSVALLAAAPVVKKDGFPYVIETRAVRRSMSVRITGALLMMFLDVLIDPVALRGDKWFLGQIYGYPYEGAYFGVTAANFIGWFLVGYVLIFVLQLIDHGLRNARDVHGFGVRWRYEVGLGLYAGVAVFNIAVAFMIGEWVIGAAGFFMTSLLAVFLYSTIKRRLASTDINAAWDKHRGDFGE